MMTKLLEWFLGFVSYIIVVCLGFEFPGSTSSADLSDGSYVIGGGWLTVLAIVFLISLPFAIVTAIWEFSGRRPSKTLYAIAAPLVTLTALSLYQILSWGIQPDMKLILDDIWFLIALSIGGVCMAWRPYRFNK